MSREIAVREQKPFELSEKQLNIIANTEFVPKEKRGKMDLILASVFRGRALGIDDFTAINEIHIVNGRPGESAALAAGLVRRRGHFIDGQVSPSGAVAHGRRADNGAELTVEFGPAHAKAAGLGGTATYSKYPQSMYWARAVTQLCRSLFSDVFIGGVYTPEELGADYIDDADVIDHDPQTPWEMIPDEADDGVGGLVEPETDSSGDVAARPSSAEDPQAVVAGGSSGSTSPMDMLIATYGRDAAVAAYKTVFPDRPFAPLDEDEVELLADHLASAGVGA